MREDTIDITEWYEMQGEDYDEEAARLARYDEEYWDMIDRKIDEARGK